MPAPGNRRKHEEAEIRIGWRMAGMGLEVSTQVAAGALLGWLFDQWQDTKPTGLLIGAILGIVVGMWSLIAGTIKLNRLLDKKHPTAGRGRPLSDDDWDDDDSNSTDR